MTQSDFEYLIMHAMQLTKPQVQSMLRTLISELKLLIKIGNEPVVVNLGTFFIRVIQRHYYRDWRTGQLVICPTKTVIKMKYWRWQKQQLTPTWIPKLWDSRTKTYYNAVFIGPKPNPDSDLAHRLCLKTGIDLLTWNRFINAFAGQISSVVLANDKVVLNNFGTFKKQIHLARRIKSKQDRHWIYIPACETIKFRQSKNILK